VGLGPLGDSALDLRLLWRCGRGVRARTAPMMHVYGQTFSA